jgi:hypothetical protein
MLHAQTLGQPPYLRSELMHDSSPFHERLVTKARRTVKDKTEAHPFEQSDACRPEHDEFAAISGTNPNAQMNTRQAVGPVYVHDTG